MTKVFLIGNLTRDPELTETSGGVPVCRFGVAVNRGYGENRATDFYNVTAWRRLGEQVAQYTKKVPRPVRKLAGAVAKRLPEFKGKHFIIRGAMEPYQRFMRANYVFTDPAERQKYLKRPITSKAPEEYSKRYFDEVQGLDEPTQLQYVDMHTWMIYDILLKADRMSMANSLELRVPFLDKKMLELSCRIPSRYRADCATETTKKALPKKFQKAEFVLEHGFLDGIVPRSRQKELLVQLLSMHKGG